MKKTFVKLAVLLAIPLSLIGCNNKKKEQPIVNKDESTIIKGLKSADDLLKKKDYKSIAYGYISHIKDEISSYESDSTGSVRAKVMFFNYDIKYHSVTYKRGSTFYSKDDSKSTLSNVQNEFYQVDKDKILVSRDLKKYTVYTLEDYHKISYTADQYMVMGYVFNDESILKAELVSDKGDDISIKYTLDNELATNHVKVDFKNGGSLSSYPVFKTIELTLSMKRDFTPTSYSIHAVYDASRAVIGTTEVTQNGECKFSKVNESITIPNETFLAEQLGAKPSEIDTDEEERSVKDELIHSFTALDWGHGVNVAGNLSLSLLGTPMVLSLDANATFDVSRLSEDKLFSILSLYMKLQGDENLNSLLSMLKLLIVDKLGEYASLLDNFKSIEAIYDGEGSLYLVPTNTEDVTTSVLKIKLTDILDALLKRINLYNLINGSSDKDYFDFTKKEGEDQNNYSVEITLTDETKASVKEAIDNFFANSSYSMVKMMLGYKDFEGIKITVNVVDGLMSSVDAAVNYINNSDVSTTLVTLHLDLKNQAFDYDTKISAAKELYNSYQATLPLKGRIDELLNNQYVSKTYVANVDKAIEEYDALTDVQKNFFKKDTRDNLLRAKKEVNDIYLFLETYQKIDLEHLTNESILVLATAYHLNTLKSNLLKDEIGEENYNIVVGLDSKVDYSSFDSVLDKMVAVGGEDETAWGLTDEEIKGSKLIFDIALVSGSVKNEMQVKLLLKAITMSYDILKDKIDSLYNSLDA